MTRVRRPPGWLNKAHTDGVYVDGDSVLIDDVLFTICPWWDGPHGRAMLGERLAIDAEQAQETLDLGLPRAADRFAAGVRRPPRIRRRGARGVDPPLPARPDPRRPHPPGPVRGRRGLGAAIDQTWIFNPGQQPGPVPTYVVVDLEQDTAVWVSATDIEEIALKLRSVV